MIKTALLEIFHPFVVGYRWIADHLTKWLGLIGLGFMQLLSLDTEPIRQAATYLPPTWALWVAKILFALVIARGYYTGWKAKQKAEILPPPQPGTVSSSDVAVKLMLLALLVGTVTSTCIAMADTTLSAAKLAKPPLTSIVVMQCNLIVVVYMTMPDGRLLRYDKSNHISSDELMLMAYSAASSERVEISCKDEGIMGYERHDPI